MDMDEYSQVISKYDRLCTDRDNHSFWAENITEAGENITSLIVWQNFYAYLANSDHVFTGVWKESLGEQVDKGLTAEYDNQKYDTKTVQNGNVTFIKLTPQNLHASNKTPNGKRLDLISQGIQEEKSDLKPQGCDEIRKSRIQKIQEGGPGQKSSKTQRKR